MEKDDSKSGALSWCLSSATDIGGSRENQDDMFIWEKKEFGILVVGILDGHGREVGQVAANCAKASILDFLHDHFLDLLEHPYDCLVDMMKAAHLGVKEGFMKSLRSRNLQVEWVPEGYMVKRTNSASQWTCVHGGSSCSVIAIVGSTLYSTNVGDSSAILCAQRPVLSLNHLVHVGDSALASPESEETSNRTHDRTHTDSKSDGSELSQTLVVTAEHSPESPSEYVRFRNFRPRPTDAQHPALMVVYDSSTHDKSRCNPVFTLNSSGYPVVTNRGSYYKNVRQEWASLVAAPSSAKYQDALAFTRSIGDFHLQIYGVSHLPEVHSVDLREFLGNHSSALLCVVVASDGIWDNWKYEDVTSYVMQPEMIQKARYELETNKEVSPAESVAQALINQNEIFARNNFGSQADNATGVVVYLTAGQVRGGGTGARGARGAGEK